MASKVGLFPSRRHVVAAQNPPYYTPTLHPIDSLYTHSVLSIGPHIPVLNHYQTEQVSEITCTHLSYTLTHKEQKHTYVHCTLYTILVCKCVEVVIWTNTNNLHKATCIEIL